MSFCASLGLALARFFELTSELFLSCAKYFLNEEDSEESVDENSDGENDVIDSLQPRTKDQEDEVDSSAEGGAEEYEDDTPAPITTTDNQNKIVSWKGNQITKLSTI